jgi:hypothetical protein
VIDEIDGATGAGENVRGYIDYSASEPSVLNKTLDKLFHSQSCPADPEQMAKEEYVIVILR